jgi:hypothetical protein
MMSEPTFVASRDGLCGFVLMVEDGQVDAYTPSGNLLGVFRDRIEAVGYGDVSYELDRQNGNLTFAGSTMKGGIATTIIGGRPMHGCDSSSAVG